MAYGTSNDFVTKLLYPFATNSVGKRGATLLKKTMCAGIILFRGRDKFSVVYKHRKATLTVNDDETKDVWLGTSSNKASSVRPVTMSEKICMNVLCVVNKSDLPDGVTIAKGTTDINISDPKLAEFFDDADAEVKVAVRLPASLPAPFGYSFKVGSMNQGLFDGLDQVENESTFYPSGL